MKTRFPLFSVLSLLLTAPALCSSFSGVVLTTTGTPIPLATVYWNNPSICVPSPLGAPICSPSTVSGSTIAASDGTFSALNLPADTYTVCVEPPAGSPFLPSCQWSPTPPVKLLDGQDLTGLQISLLTGSLVVIQVNDPFHALSQSFFRPSVVIGSGGYYGTSYDSTRAAYTSLIPQGIAAHLFFDTLLVVLDPQGNSLPVDSSVLPFTSAGAETPLSVTVTPAVVNAASYLPGIANGVIATLFGTSLAATAGLCAAPGYPLPTELCGTSVTVNGIPAPVLAVAQQPGQGQINFQVPHESSFNEQLVIVVSGNGAQQTFYVRNWASQLGIFPSLAHADGTPVSEANPAQPAEQITIYWTGLAGYSFQYPDGSLYPPDGAASPNAAPCVSYFAPTVRIGAMAATVDSCSATPGLNSIGQLVVTIPPGLASGDYNVAVTLDNTNGNLVKLPVRLP